MVSKKMKMKDEKTQIKLRSLLYDELEITDERYIERECFC